MAATKSHYEVLGVKRDAPSDEIKKNFRKLAAQLHPDTFGDAPEKAIERQQATERFKQVTEAYNTLIDPEKRARYNQTLDYYSGPAQAGPGTAPFQTTVNFSSATDGLSPEEARLIYEALFVVLNGTRPNGARPRPQQFDWNRKRTAAAARTVLFFNIATAVTRSMVTVAVGTIIGQAFLSGSAEAFLSTSGNWGFGILLGVYVSAMLSFVAFAWTSVVWKTRKQFYGPILVSVKEFARWMILLGIAGGMALGIALF